MNQKADYVSVKTIHKSKGLEYPFIFLMHSERMFSKKPSLPNLLAAESGMIGLQMVDRKRLLKIKSAVYQYLCYEQEKQDKSEEMRLLYVAMTRAMRRLYIVGNPRLLQLDPLFRRLLRFPVPASFRP